MKNKIVLILETVILVFFILVASIFWFNATNIITIIVSLLLCVSYSIMIVIIMIDSWKYK